MQKQDLCPFSRRKSVLSKYSDHPVAENTLFPYKHWGTQAVFCLLDISPSRCVTTEDFGRELRCLHSKTMKITLEKILLLFIQSLHTDWHSTKSFSRTLFYLVFQITPWVRWYFDPYFPVEETEAQKACSKQDPGHTAGKQICVTLNLLFLPLPIA